MAQSKGVWFDTKSKQVVETEPEEGVQIVAPGSDESSATEAEVQRYRDLADGVSNVGTLTTGVDEVAADQPAAKPPAKSKP